MLVAGRGRGRERGGQGRFVGGSHSPGSRGTEQDLQVAVPRSIPVQSARLGTAFGAGEASGAAAGAPGGAGS